MAARLSASVLAPLRPSPNSTCAARQLTSSLSRNQQIRGVAQTHLRKVAEGEERWKARAEKIQSGELRHVWDILDERGFIKDVAGYAPTTTALVCMVPRENGEHLLLADY